MIGNTCRSAFFNYSTVPDMSSQVLDGFLDAAAKAGFDTRLEKIIKRQYQEPACQPVPAQGKPIDVGGLFCPVIASYLASSNKSKMGFIG